MILTKRTILLYLLLCYFSLTQKSWATCQSYYKTTDLNISKKNQYKESSCGAKSFYLPRSQGSNTARWLSGWQEYFDDCVCIKTAHGTVGLTVEHSHSFNNQTIAQYLFSNTCLSFKGSQVSDRDPNKDLLADYFGLPTTFQGAICFNPKIVNTVAEINYYLSLAPWCSGLYTRVYFPFTVSSWDLGINCTEQSNIDKIVTEFPDCYMSNTSFAYNQTSLSIAESLTGCALFGDMKSPYDFGIFPFSKRTKAGVADIYFMLGWNPILCPEKHFAIFAQLVIPGGNRPKSEILFEPIVGNGKNWEFGGGLEGHYIFYESDCSSFGIYFMGYVTHRFKTFQVRSFDFCNNGPLSRYMLLKEFDKDNNYIHNLFNAIDYNTKTIRVGSLWVTDDSVKLSYYYKNWGIDAGYNLWAKTTEKLHIINDLFPADLNNRRFGIKGTEGACYKVIDNQNQEVLEENSLNSTQNRATITRGSITDNPETVNVLPGQSAITWDNQLARNSNPPIIINYKKFNKQSAIVPKQLTHKFFANIDYTYTECPWQPQIGIGGEVEFDGYSKYLSSLYQWGVWIKGQLIF